MVVSVEDPGPGRAAPLVPVELLALLAEGRDDADVRQIGDVVRGPVGELLDEPGHISHARIAGGLFQDPDEVRLGQVLFWLEQLVIDHGPLVVICSGVVLGEEVHPAFGRPEYPVHPRRPLCLLGEGIGDEGPDPAMDLGGLDVRVRVEGLVEDGDRRLDRGLNLVFLLEDIDNPTSPPLVRV